MNVLTIHVAIIMYPKRAGHLPIYLGARMNSLRVESWELALTPTAIILSSSWDHGHCISRGAAERETPSTSVDGSEFAGSLPPGFGSHLELEALHPVIAAGDELAGASGGGGEGGKMLGTRRGLAPQAENSLRPTWPPPNFEGHGPLQPFIAICFKLKSAFFFFTTRVLLPVPLDVLDILRPHRLLDPA